MPKIRMRKTRRWLGLAAAVLLLSGCAGIWETAPSRMNAPQWSLTPPEGWMHLCTAESDMFSKNGPYLEYILVQSRQLDQGFRFTRQKLNARMLPNEAARLIINNMRHDRHIQNFRLLSSEPATLGGLPGFKLSYMHQDQMGVTIQTVYYGVIMQGTFFNLRYSAARRHYFDSQLHVFGGVVKSVRFFSDLKSPASDTRG